MNTVYIAETVVNEIYRTMISDTCECGGILGMNRNGVITHYCFDYFAELSDRNAYRPSAEWLNSVIQEWYHEEVDFCGIIHSHPYGYPELSVADRQYAEEILEYNSSLDKIYFPILTKDSHVKELAFWSIEKDENLISKNNYIALHD